jgi:TorA maturation chaperone TorD
MQEKPGHSTVALQHCQELGNICQFYSRIWLREIDLASLTELAQEPLATHYRELGGSVPTEINQNVIDELSVDYCQLLIGPKDFISPVQSVWAESKFSGQAFADVQKFYALIANYQPPSELLDHIGVELDFMSRMFFTAHESANKEHARKEIVAAIRQFFSQHIRWSAPMLKAAEARAKTEFYRCFAKSTRAFFALIESEFDSGVEG